MTQTRIVVSPARFSVSEEYPWLAERDEDGAVVTFTGKVRNHNLGDSVKALTVGGVAPTEATVKDGSYVVQRPFVLVTKDGTKLSDTAQKFFDFATSADAVSIINQAGAVAAK